MNILIEFPFPLAEWGEGRETELARQHPWEAWSGWHTPEEKPAAPTQVRLPQLTVQTSLLPAARGWEGTSQESLVFISTLFPVA